MSSCQTDVTASSTIDYIGGEDISHLLAMLHLVKDFRGSHGKMYSLDYVLAAVIVATFGRAMNYTEIAEHVTDIPQDMLARLGAPYCHFSQTYLAPSLSTISNILKKVDDHALDLVTGTWLHELATRGREGDMVLAMDAKVLRGTRTSGNRQAAVFSAMIHGIGVVIGQIRVPDGTNEITQVTNLVKKLRYTRGRTILTADAAHTQFTTARFLRARGIDVVMNIKGNQPKLYRAVFERCLTIVQETPGHVVEENSHGRIRRWTVWTTSAEGIRFPHMHTVALICREEFDPDGNRLIKEYAYILTTLRTKRATPEAIYTHVRQHWGIENKIHYVRDTAFREDACQAHTGNGPQNLATIRNLVLGLLRLHGVTKIAKTLRSISRDRYRALRFMVT